MERTFVMIKPDGVQRRCIGRIVDRFEQKGLRIIGLKMVTLTKKQAQELYKIHKGRPFYDGLMAFVTAGPVVTMVLEGTRVIQIVRTQLGATFSYEAQPGTIRGDFGSSKGYNLIHGSDSPASARREMKIFFKASELAKHQMPDHNWVYEGPERT